MIDRTPLYRPRVSRETRQLVATALLAIVALFVLARVRYPDRPPTPNPVPTLLTQLASRPTLSELATESMQVRNRLGASLLAVESGSSTVAAFRIRDDTAIAFLTGDRRRHPEGADVMASDAATGLTLMHVGAAAAPVAPMPWTPRQLEEPRYLLATVASGSTVALRPTYVASLQPVTSPAWSAPIWRVTAASDLEAGSLVFTYDSELAGLVIPRDDGLAIVPGATLLADAHRLREQPLRLRGYLGVDAQALTAPLAAATGARGGVILAWVDPRGPAARHVRAGDVIEASEGRWVETREQWDVRVARLTPGERLVLGVRRHGEWLDVQLVAVEEPGGPLPLGLTLRRVADVGSEVMGVDRHSAAGVEGLQPGDVITLIGSISAPTPAQVRDAFAAAADGRPVLVAVSRGTTSRVTTLHR